MNMDDFCKECGHVRIENEETKLNPHFNHYMDCPLFEELWKEIMDKWGDRAVNVMLNRFKNEPK